MDKKHYNDVKFLNEEALKGVREFNACQRYKEALGILEEAQKNVDMYEGRQWLGFKKSKFPFEPPILNNIANIVDQKVSSVCSKLYKLEFVVENNVVATTKLTKFNETVMRELKQTTRYKQMAYDAILKGTGLKYDYWNTSTLGLYGNMEGGVDTSIVDVADFSVKNPHEKDIEKQESIIIRSRESVESVRKSCNTLSEENKEKYIVSSAYKSRRDSDIEKSESDNVYSYIRFFKQDGEVYFEKFTDEILYQFARPLSPKKNEDALKKRYEELEKQTTDESLYKNDNVNKSGFDNLEKNNYDERMENKFKANRYPVVRLVFVERDNSFFGVPYATQLIGIQKLINQLTMTTMLTAMKSIMPTVVAKAGALGSQKVDFSVPNRVITDYSGTGVNDAIKILNTGTIPTTHYELAQSLTSFAKDTYKANDILNDGRNIGANASGAMIANLKSLQDMPIQQWQEAVSGALEDEGRILEMFYKLFYHDKPFTYQIEEGDPMPDGYVFDQTHHNYLTDTFEGEEYENTPFNVSVIVSETSKSTEALALSIIEPLILNGTIATLSPDHLDLFCDMIPINVLPQKDILKRGIQKMRNSENAILKQQVAELQQMLEQMGMRQQAVEEEYAGKINQYNEQIKRLSTVARYTSQNQGNNSQK